MLSVIWPCNQSLGWQHIYPCITPTFMYLLDCHPRDSIKGEGAVVSRWGTHITDILSVQVQVQVQYRFSSWATNMIRFSESPPSILFSEIHDENIKKNKNRQSNLVGNRPSLCELNNKAKPTNLWTPILHWFVLRLWNSIQYSVIVSASLIYVFRYYAFKKSRERKTFKVISNSV